MDCENTHNDLQLTTQHLYIYGQVVFNLFREKNVTCFFDNSIKEYEVPC